jgi:pimeloyl-ACP methyl ester carboxylesterase
VNIKPRRKHTFSGAFLGAAFAALLSTQATAKGAMCHESHVSVDRQNLWVDLQGSDSPTVVFEAGNGNDSSVWTDIAPRVRQLGVRTFVYDRAGLGKSKPRVGPYKVEREVGFLRGALRQCGVRGSLILVAHSYGGLMALLMASADSNVDGIVLLDAAIPQTFTNSEVVVTLAEFRPQYAEVRREAPELAAAIIPLMEAMPASLRRVQAAKVPTNLPIIDVVADSAKYTRDEAKQIHDQGHIAFVAESSARELVIAKGSGHKIMIDSPDTVLYAIERMLTLVGGAQSR